MHQELNAYAGFRDRRVAVATGGAMVSTVSVVEAPRAVTVLVR